MSGYSDPYFDLAEMCINEKATLFLDIGCHQGDTVLRFRDSGVLCPIVAFDPVPENLEIARRKLKKQEIVSFENIALCDKDGKAVFFVNQNDQTSSLLENDIGNNISFPEQSSHRSTIEVSTVKLDSWIKNYTGDCSRIIIKSDCQGAEGLIVKGGTQTIKNNVIAFYGEVMMDCMYKGQASFERLREQLEVDCQMVLSNIYPPLRDNSGKVIQMDVLWLNKTLIDKFKK
jgi:FkbM family methyltransferase